MVLERRASLADVASPRVEPPWSRALDSEQGWLVRGEPAPAMLCGRRSCRDSSAKAGPFARIHAATVEFGGAVPALVRVRLAEGIV